jgi:hypothetical protein
MSLPKEWRGLRVRRVESGWLRTVGRGSVTVEAFAQGNGLWTAKAWVNDYSNRGWSGRSLKDPLKAMDLAYSDLLKHLHKRVANQAKFLRDATRTLECAERAVR